MMKRWMRGYRNTILARRINAALEFNGVTTLPDYHKFGWPTTQEIATFQESHLSTTSPKYCTRNESGLLQVENATWIPDICTEIKIRLLNLANAENAGHRGADSTCNALREAFTWEYLCQEIRAFVAEFLFCVLSKSGNKIPRPLSKIFHAKNNPILPPLSRRES